MDPSNTNHIIINKNANILPLGPYILIPLMKYNTRIMVIVSLAVSGIFNVSQCPISLNFNTYN